MLARVEARKTLTMGAYHRQLACWESAPAIKGPVAVAKLNVLQGPVQRVGLYTRYAMQCSRSGDGLEQPSLLQRNKVCSDNRDQHLDRTGPHALYSYARSGQHPCENERAGRTYFGPQ